MKLSHSIGLGILICLMGLLGYLGADPIAPRGVTVTPPVTDGGIPAFDGTSGWKMQDSGLTTAGVQNAASLTGTVATAVQSNITIVGTLAEGVWQGTVIDEAYLDADVWYRDGSVVATGDFDMNGNSIVAGTDNGLSLTAAGTKQIDGSYVLLFDTNQVLTAERGSIRYVAWKRTAADGGTHEWYSKIGTSPGESTATLMVLTNNGGVALLDISGAIQLGTGGSVDAIQTTVSDVDDELTTGGAIVDYAGGLAVANTWTATNTFSTTIVSGVGADGVAIVIGADAWISGDGSEAEGLQIEADGDAVFSDDLAVTGNVTGKTPITTDTAAAVTCTVSQCKGELRINGDNDVIDYTLPAAEAGLVISFANALHAQVITVDVDASDTIILNDGTMLDAGDSADSSGAIDDKGTFVAINSSNWMIYAEQNVWVDGGP